MLDFISLTDKTGGIPIKVNPMYITFIKANANQSEIGIMNSEPLTVSESVDKVVEAVTSWKVSMGMGMTNTVQK